MPVIDLETIFTQCLEGDKLAWEALVRKTQSRIFGLAMFYVRDRGEAEDLAQEIFVKIYRNLRQVKDPAGFRAWMFSIARNCSLDRIRKMKNVPQSIDAAQIEETEPAKGPSEEQRMGEKERRELLYRAMEGLSEQAREILLLKEIQQLKLTEVAKILSLPIGTIKSRSNRARVDLAKSIRAIDPSYGVACGNGG